jgi:protein TonB
VFQQSIVGSGRRSWSFAISLVAQTALLGLVLLATLMYTPLLPAAKFTAVFLEPPPPPPGPPPPPADPVRVRQPEVFSAELRTPTEIPDKVAIIQEEALPAPPLDRTYVGVPGGTGPAGPGVLNSIGGAVLPPPKPPEPKVEKKPDPPPPSAPMKVSGGVQAARLAHRVEPVYPPLARQARISGAVRLRAIISADGAVEQLNVISGHPLLIRAAADAVRQWRYRPTLLTGRAVPVSTEIEVNFVLR